MLRILLLSSVLHGAVAMAADPQPVEISFPEVGTRLVFDKTGNGSTARLVWTVVDDTQHRGRRVHRLVGAAGFEFYDAETNSWTLSQIGEHIQEVKPHRRWGVTVQETLEVPAGRFDTLRVESPGEPLSITLWYAPAIHFYVRRETRGMVNVTQELVEYSPAQR